LFEKSTKAKRRKEGWGKVLEWGRQSPVKGQECLIKLDRRIALENRGSKGRKAVEGGDLGVSIGVK